MPLVNLTHLGLNNTGQQSGVVSNLAGMVGNLEYGQGVFLTGSERAIVTEAADLVTPTIRQLLASNTDIAAWMAAEGYVFYAADADQNDTVTGQTSFADTTPSFTLRVPANTVCVPLMFNLAPTGTVAGGDITIIAEFTDVDRYASGGTSEAVHNSRSRSYGGALPTNQCTLITTPTITATGATLPMGYTPFRVTLGADVSPAEGISNEQIWGPNGPDWMVGPASLNIWTYAASTGPTWFWNVKWLEFPIARFGF